MKKNHWMVVSVLIIIVSITSAFVGCSNDPANTYAVTYNANGATTGEVPSDQIKIHGADLTLASNTGNLALTGYTFAGWDNQADGSGTGYAAGSSYAANAKVILYAKWRELTIRDIGPGGGYIFYDDEADGSDDIPGYRYLEAAPARWSGSSDPMYIFGHHRTADDGNDLLVGTATAIGSGKANTVALVAAMKEETYSNRSGDGDATAKAKYAAKACADYSGGGYDDWFLPSKDELDLIYDHLKSKNLGGFSNTVYWSSSELNSDSAWYRNFENGNQGATDRNFNYLVRPVRAF